MRRVLIAHPPYDSHAAIRCPFTWLLDLLHPSCDAQNMFWHLRDAAGQATKKVVGGRREASRTLCTWYPHIPKVLTPVLIVCSESCCSLRRMRIVAGRRASALLLPTRESSSRHHVALRPNHHTPMCDDPPPEKSGFSSRLTSVDTMRPIPARNYDPASRPREHQQG